MKEIIGNLLKKENVRQNLSSLRQEIKDENALAEALKLLAGEDELLVSFMGADDAKTRKNAALLIGDLHMSQLSDEVFKVPSLIITTFLPYLTLVLMLALSL